MSVAIAQQSTPIGKEHWKWSVWLEGAATELDEVVSVEYTLHPTFSPPVHRITNRASVFRLNASGWGEFMIHARVRYRDGRSESLHHWLELADAASMRDGQPFGAVGAAVDEGRSLKPRAVFLSSALADRATAANIRAVLEQDESLDVSTSQDLQSLEADVPVERLIRNEMGRVGGAVFLVSERKSPWLRYELAIAKELGIPTAIVNVGTTQGIPSETAVPNLVLKVTGPADAEQAAHRIAGWAEGLD